MMSIDRRGALALGGLAMLGGCASFRNSPFWGTISGGGDDKSPKVPVTRADADKVPYASMLLWLGDGMRAFVVLGEVKGPGRLVWYTAKREPIVTYGPFITRFLGQDVELLDTRYGGGWSPDVRRITIEDILRDIDVRRRKDGTATVRSKSTFRKAETGTVTILERPMQLTRYVETVEADPRTSFENEYWIEEATGRCFKSRQWALPTMPPVNIEILRYPSVG